ncbi:hypothetical protein GH733_001114 [Mirounga leonina]|nr:hypothetical protein GH733_001114 [Mirounga leonina]
MIPILLEGFPSAESFTLVFTPLSVFLCASPGAFKVCWRRQSRGRWSHSLGAYRRVLCQGQEAPWVSTGRRRVEETGQLGKRKDTLSLGPVWCRPGVSLS